MHPSPFQRTPLAAGPAFADRTVELARLEHAFSSPGSALVLYGPRRMGKSALLHEAARRVAGRRHRVAIVDLATAVDAPDAVRRLLEAVRGAVGHTWQSVLHAVANKLQLALTITPNPDGTGLPGITLGLDARTAPRPGLFTDALAAVDAELARRKLHLALGLDEFQRLLSWGGTDVEWALKASLEHSRRIAWVMSGSATTLIEAMVTNRDRALWKLADHLRLGPVPVDEFAAWIAARAPRGPGHIPLTVAHDIVRLAGPRTRDILLLAHATWRMAYLYRSPAEAMAAMDDLVRETSAPYEQGWQQLSQREQRILRLLAVHADVPLTAELTRSAHALGAASSIGVALTGLRKKGILAEERGQPRFDDPFFRRWVERATSGDIDASPPPVRRRNTG